MLDTYDLKIDLGTVQSYTPVYNVWGKYSVPDGTKHVIPIYQGCTFGTVYLYDFSHALDGYIIVNAYNSTPSPHGMDARYLLLFLG